MNKIGLVIRNRRGETPQYKIAKAAGISCSALSQIENCHRRPSWDVLVNIANALNTTALDMLVESEFDFKDNGHPKGINAKRMPTIAAMCS